MAEAITVQVCYAPPGQVWQRSVTLPAGSTLAQAIASSGFQEDFPEVDPEAAGTGVYGRRRSLDHVLHEHDRVEIYRPLVFDPKESRRRRAEHKQSVSGRAPRKSAGPAGKGVG
ncbi:Persistence and stress-resistance antitoxin PasI [Pigmentiphaga humi]|uniref:UPF0125 protein PIGHUM_04428 n=1 Tax=Pigmentiphaga humi TaxID=2478468 RepID=A0A3P4B7Q4_9BURK|nr:RnfH family protein [Pigmentiphaga humi]VCU72329.1 Persistence and stress-resistance antitoxin PasI [Pigmentiphaga humi]